MGISAKKILLFDVTLLEKGCLQDIGRSGIFFVVFNFLKEFLKQEQFEIQLYGAYASRRAINAFLRQNFTEYDLTLLSPTEPRFIRFRRKLMKYRWISKIRHRRVNALCLSLLLFPLRVFCFLFRQVFDCNQLRADDLKEVSVFFSPFHAIPEEISRHKQIRTYLFLHDMIPLLDPDYERQGNIVPENTRKIWNSMNPAGQYFTNSEFTRQSILNARKELSETQFTVAYLAADSFAPCHEPEKIRQVREKYHIPPDKKYILSLCSLAPRKNLPMALKAFNLLLEKTHDDNLVFVLSGGDWDRRTEEINQEIQSLDRHGKIIKTGYVEDGDIPVLYSNAEFFVYLSLFEGFGLPPLEAMRCGCPVLTSNTTSLPEVVGDAGLMVDPRNLEEIAEAFRQLHENENLRQTLSAKGQERAAQFSWKNCADVIVRKMAQSDHSVR